jgi:hypothetical protein
MPVDTINHIFGIGCIMSANTNNVPGIRGVTSPMRNPNHGKIWFCAIRLPNFLTLYTATYLGAVVAAASLDVVPSPSPSPTPSLTLP